ncbi:HpcH/HpaI aldolase/citrate lyase family protein [Mycolicibacterium austroafricanum]|uniref:HpcH/HpaI aldolase/citrate lyase family protein n=1 Tax=Mycolicibacterium austroafricanum TaxID=39687 RepID=UPI001F2C522D|nr:CoA ester lyase [Mycolicibacterium austroafricanum]
MFPNAERGGVIRLTRDLARARSLLFVPGTRSERFGKAVHSGTDAVVLDLEDAVSLGDKEQARANVASWLSGGQCGVLRINARETPWHDDDVELAGRYRCPVMIPKVEGREDVEAVRRRLPPGTPLIVLLESARALVEAASICQAPGVIRAAFGSFDLAAELGIDPEVRGALRHARSVIVVASAAARISPPIDGVTGAVQDLALLRDDVEHAKDLGFAGKLCIHPDQVDVVNRHFSPSQAEFQWAENILEGIGSEGVAVVDGRMIDAPVLARARRIIASSRG